MGHLANSVVCDHKVSRLQCQPLVLEELKTIKQVNHMNAGFTWIIINHYDAKGGKAGLVIAVGIKMGRQYF